MGLLRNLGEKILPAAGVGGVSFLLNGQPVTAGIAGLAALAYSFSAPSPESSPPRFGQPRLPTSPRKPKRKVYGEDEVDYWPIFGGVRAYSGETDDQIPGYPGVDRSRPATVFDLGAWVSMGTCNAFTGLRINGRFVKFHQTAAGTRPAYAVENTQDPYYGKVFVYQYFGSVSYPTALLRAYPNQIDTRFFDRDESWLHILLIDNNDVTFPDWPVIHPIIGGVSVPNPANVSGEKIFSNNCAAVEYDIYSTMVENMDGDRLDLRSFQEAYNRCLVQSPNDMQFVDSLNHITLSQGLNSSTYQNFPATSKRASFNGIVEQNGGLLSDILDACDWKRQGTHYWHNGKLRITVRDNIPLDRPEKPLLHLTDEDVALDDGGRPQLVPRPLVTERFNVVRGTVARSVAHNYDPVEFVVKSRTLIENDGEERVHDLGEVRYCSDVMECIRTSHIMLQMQGASTIIPDFRVRGTLETLGLLPGDPLMLSNTYLGVDKVPCEVVMPSKLNENIVRLTLLSYPRNTIQDTYNLVDPQRFRLALPRPEAPTQIRFDTERNLSTGINTTLLYFTNPTFYPKTHLRWKKQTDTDWQGTENWLNERTASKQYLQTFVGLFDDDTDYDLQLQNENRNGQLSNWSSTINYNPAHDLLPPTQPVNLTLEGQIGGYSWSKSESPDEDYKNTELTSTWTTSSEKEVPGSITGAAAVSEGNIYGHTESMVWDNENERILYISNHILRAYNPLTNTHVPVATGVPSRRLNVPAGTSRFEGLTFVDGVLYGVAVAQSIHGSRVLCKFNADLTSYSTHTLTGLPSDFLGDIAGASVDDAIYLNYGQQLWHINLTTYVATSRGRLAYSDMYSLGNHNGKLYSIRVETANHAELYEVNKTDASLTRVGTRLYPRSSTSTKGPELLVGCSSLNEQLNGLFYTSYAGAWSSLNQPLFRIPGGAKQTVTQTTPHSRVDIQVGSSGSLLDLVTPGDVVEFNVSVKDVDRAGNKSLATTGTVSSLALLKGDKGDKGERGAQGNPGGAGATGEDGAGDRTIYFANQSGLKPIAPSPTNSYTSTGVLLSSSEWQTDDLLGANALLTKSAIGATGDDPNLYGQWKKNAESLSPIKRYVWRGEQKKVSGVDQPWPTDAFVVELFAIDGAPAEVMTVPIPREANVRFRMGMTYNETTKTLSGGRWVSRETPPRPGEQVTPTVVLPADTPETHILRRIPYQYRFGSTGSWTFYANFTSISETDANHATAADKWYTGKPSQSRVAELGEFGYDSWCIERLFDSQSIGVIGAWTEPLLCLISTSAYVPRAGLPINRVVNLSTELTAIKNRLKALEDATTTVSSVTKLATPSNVRIATQILPDRSGANLRLTYTWNAVPNAAGYQIRVSQRARYSDTWAGDESEKGPVSSGETVTYRLGAFNAARLEVQALADSSGDYEDSDYSERIEDTLPVTDTRTKFPAPSNFNVTRSIEIHGGQSKYAYTCTWTEVSGAEYQLSYIFNQDTGRLDADAHTSGTKIYQGLGTTDYQSFFLRRIGDATHANSDWVNFNYSTG